MELTTVWFVLIAFLWVGYFVLEGFDFGVGMLAPVLGRDDRERRVVINTIGPHFDANEVWVIVAVGATFAAFPDWYATLLSGFYLPLLAVLVGLIVRLVAIDYRSKRAELSWRRRWDAAIALSSAVPAFLWGLVFGNVVHGLAIDADFTYVGGLAALFHPFALLSGLVSLTLFLTHGAFFVALKTGGVIHDRAVVAAGRIGTGAVVLTLGWLLWLNLEQGTMISYGLGLLAVVALLGSLAANARGRDGWAFTGTVITVVAVFTTVFVLLFPALMPSTLDPAWSLTTSNASATPYTLTIITWCAAVATPVVLGYQAWTYWVFRRRLTVASIVDDVITPETAAR